jgi:hypothetical protein
MAEGKKLLSSLFRIAEATELYRLGVGKDAKADVPTELETFLFSASMEAMCRNREKETLALIRGNVIDFKGRPKKPTS